MKESKEYIEKNMKNFLDLYEIFDILAHKERYIQRCSAESIALFNVYLNSRPKI